MKLKRRNDDDDVQDDEQRDDRQSQAKKKRHGRGNKEMIAFTTTKRMTGHNGDCAGDDGSEHEEKATITREG
jgi:hypothetical protein